MKARLYRTSDRQGKVKEFEIVDSLPEKGERVNFSDPGFIWGEAEKATLDPEQRHADENEIADYDFYIVPEIDTEDGEVAELHYFAVLKKGEESMRKVFTGYAIINSRIEEAPFCNEYTVFESQDAEEIIQKLAALIRVEENPEDFTVEIYTVDEDGYFVAGCDYDTAENFMKKMDR